MALHKFLDLLAVSSWHIFSMVADMDPARQLALSILGGFLAAVAFALCTWLYARARAKWWRRAFKQLFGPDVARAGEFHLVYTSFNLPPVYDFVDGEKKEIKHPYQKPGTRNVSFSIDEPTSSGEMRAVKHLAEKIVAEVGKTPILSTDYALRGAFNVSLVSLGSQFSNTKSEDALKNPGNPLIGFRDGWFCSRKTDRKVPLPRDGHEYGLLLKIRPIQFPERTWIMCAGYGEWGTSGTAFYLAQNWREIHKYAGDNPFAMLLRIEREKDESAIEVLRARTPEELEEEINRLEAEAADAGS